METGKLKKFAQWARRYLREQVGNKLEQILATDSGEMRKSKAVKDLMDEIRKYGKDQVVEKVAYVWFNRFCALRFMDANGYNRTGIVSPAEGMTLPEILQEAKLGNVDAELTIDRVKLSTLLSEAKQDEAFRMLLVAACNLQSQLMPFMFEKIADYTELLMPSDLLSESSVLQETRNALTNDVCQDVEVIGWLYQFYISEKKDEVFDGLKKNKKITPENIPAATQLFTPNWIVRYLVENSLGRLWMLNKPDSRLVAQMDYYIKPEQAETDFLKITSPEELKVCDPACGSGHMLVYAFELLYAIYEEEGYDASEIPGLILTNNLFGLELDERAGELAAFALTMKAREKYRRFFRKAIQPNICVLEKVEIPQKDLEDYIQKMFQEVGRDIFSKDLLDTILQFQNADNFGSLIRPILCDIQEIQTLLIEKTRTIENDNLYMQTHSAILKVLRMVEYLSPRYHVVVANPPYMGSGGMNFELKKWVVSNYPASKSDLYAAFIERSMEICIDKSFVAMITMQTWMFLNSFASLRNEILSNHSITGFLQIGYNSFPSLNSKVALACAFVIEVNSKDKQGYFFNLNNAPQSADKDVVFLNQKEKTDFFVRNSNDFKKIPNAPLAFWIDQPLIEAFKRFDKLGSVSEFRIGMATGQNEVYVRFWHEVYLSNLGLYCKSREASAVSNCKWFPYAKGGPFRRWAGNQESIVNWENDGRLLQQTKHPDGKRIWAHNFNLDNIFKPSLAWTQVTTGKPSFRYYTNGFLYDAAAGLGQTFIEDDFWGVIGLLNSKIAHQSLSVLNPTINLLPGDLCNLPYVCCDNPEITKKAITISQKDWDSFETSWDFQSLPLITAKEPNVNLAETYKNLRSQWLKSTQEMQRLEEENNRIFIDAYGLQDELTPEVTLNEITLTCNPHYRYGGDKTEEQLEGLLQQDTIKEFVSYAVGCMFGRYSLDKPGLILANAGETLEDYLKQVPQPTFVPDSDNVIPIMDVDWFGDDIAERFKSFLKLTFGEANYEENIRFIEDALGYKTTGKGKRQSIRDYFLKDFYTDHWKRYKKRPIYWMFSSPKGTFNALIYMHRYRPDTVSTVLNEYLREFSQKLTAHRDNKKQESLTAEGKLKIALEKEIATLGKQIEELADYERDLFELASKSREELTIDLDDGVKVNYPKFGGVLKTIPGLDKGDE